VHHRRDLIGIEHLDPADITHLLDRSEFYFRRLVSEEPLQKESLLSGRTIANLFFEDSTRTRISFELAAKRLGADIVSPALSTSSLNKGESIVDTVKVIAAMKIDGIVIRHRSSGVPDLVRKHLPDTVRILNAGDGAREHPTQALLDAATLRESLGDLAGKNILIVGDIMHSRVARSNIYLLKKFGAQITVAGPSSLIPSAFGNVFGVTVLYELDAALSQADAVIMLRIQKERQHGCYLPSLSEFRARYGFTASRYNNSRCIILHPGPVNRTVELDDDVADSQRSLILRQVTRGVAVRMAALEWIFSE
jgi:aspartate carbamoyltransferase catalytic subunit